MSWVTTILSMAATACLTLAAMQFLVWFKPRRAWRKLLFSVTATSRQIHVPAWARLGSLGLVRLSLRSGGPWLALLCGVFALDAYAAKASIQKDPTYLIDTWETEDGLPENSATAMVQTPDGYLWFGTFNGLVRFDGVRFTVFNRANTPQLPDAGIVNLHVDQRGWLWVSTLRGTVVLADNKWQSFGTNEGWAGNYVRTFAERSNGDLLFTTFDGKILEFANGRLRQLPDPPGEPGGGYQAHVDEMSQWWVAQHQFVGHWDGQRWVQMVEVSGAAPDRTSIAAARGGGMWLFLNNVLCRYRGGTQVSRLPVPEFLGSVWSMSEDSGGNVWICTDRGIFQVSSAGKVRHWTFTNGLSSDSSRFVFEDRENNLWVGTSGGGLQRFKARRFYSFGVEERSEPPQVVSSVSANAAGDVWIATYGRGLFRRSASELTRVPLSAHDNVGRWLQSVLEDRMGRVWAGTSLQGLWLLGKHDPRVILAGEAGDNGFTTLFEDSRGRVWIASGQDACVYDSGRFRVFGLQDGLPRGPISCFAEDSSGAVWLAHQDGVFRLVKDRFMLMNDESGLPLSDIACLRGDGSGAMWMGSRTQALIRWHEGRIATVGAAAGLPVHAIYSILEDKHGNWWMTSDAGVVRAGLADLRAAADNPAARVRCQVLDKSDGLPGTEFSTGRQPMSARDAEGKLWFAMPKGVAVIDPEKSSVNEKPPPTHIEKVSYFLPASGAASGRRVELRPPFSEKVFLPPGSRQLEISYTGLSFVSAEKVRFQVKLEHEDAEWLQADNRRVAYYYDLQPRDYVFRVRAANNDGVWNEAGASLAFAVQPLFWQTLWFKALGLVMLAALVYGGVHQRMARLEKERAAQQAFTRQVILSEENERKRIAGELHDGLGQNLLLIKNRLALAAARQSDVPEHTRQLEAATAATTRAIGEVRAISHALRPTALEEVGLTKAIESMLEQLGEGSATKFAAELDKIDGLLAPEMEINLFRIVQEGLNNITRHAGAAQVILEVKREDPGLRVSLFDDGRGFDAEKLRDGAGARRGLGLASMNERVKYLTGSLDLQSAPGRGTRVTVRVPLSRPKA